ncbi:MAG: hypothetical protein OIF48_03735, partial [Silicimonas sp.]|nr:hypothetical protein [Silicimonas sp.]
APDHESPGDADGDTLYEVTVEASDGSLTDTQDLSISVADVNEGPSVTASDGTLTENAAGAVVGAVTGSDPDAGDTVTLSVDDARFEIVGGDLKLRDGVSLDYEDGDSLSVTITVTDSGGLTDTHVVSVTVSDTGEVITLGDGGESFTDTGVAETSITGGAGDDTITGHDDGATLDGGAGADQLTGGAGDDVLTGGAGDDTLAGGAGNDVATFAGNWADYTITESGGTYTVVDLRNGSPDGTDTITNVETFRFSDGDRNAADATDPGLSFTFDTSNEGWRIYDDTGDSIIGGARYNDYFDGAQIADNETGTAPWFATPLNFGGNRSDLVGGSVSFHFRNSDAQPFVDDDAATIEAMLVGNDGTEIRARINIAPTIGTVDQNASFDIDAATFGVSEAQFESVMSDLAFFGINADLR